jgi:hypothetical protein
MNSVAASQSPRGKTPWPPLAGTVNGSRVWAATLEVGSFNATNYWVDIKWEIAQL